jgi:hypothetical protein
MRKAWYGVKFFQTGRLYRLDGSKPLEKRLPTRRPDPRDALQLGSHSCFAPAYAVVSYGEAVCLISHTLYQEKTGRTTRQRDRFGTAWQKDFLAPLGKSRNRNGVQ